MLWACLRFPGLAFSAAFAVVPEAGPSALLDHKARQRLIAAANTEASSFGVRRGQSLAAARALCPALEVRPRDPGAEERLLAELAAWCYQFSGHVSLVPPNAILMEVGASLRLFDGWPLLAGRLRAGLAGQGHAHTLAATPFAAASWVFAASADGIVLPEHEGVRRMLAALPLKQSGLPAATVTSLQAMGFRRLDEVFRLPRPELTRRIGREGVNWLDRVRGHASDVLPAWQPPASFRQKIEFDGELDGSQPLLFPLRRLTRALANQLAARDGGVQRFTLTLEHARGEATRIAVAMAAPQRDAERLFELARTRLERASLPAPARAIELDAAELPVFRPPVRDLFEPVRGDGLDWPTLDERLRARLGDAALRQIALVADHRPEYASRYGRPGDTVSPPRRRRPLWLLPRPQPMRPEPAAVLAGPERIESGWWDGGDTRRDYYIVRTAQGQQAWAYLPPGTLDGWMLHGWFA
ncbi:Y-family DNA polymerase [Luteibacter yeojuensis]|uniref:DNA polymerase Y family protein n=1 Tax=Luteibacter yeojuensis TaxID=345309 RepID=A0A7X5TP03_9GAMM|nr:DNA polymerase Y family protein [Luteibacter yeojuensis]NID14268.1 DNA polymerase Y family protein [Luteibacter yeojuensis]